jgi:hypothetical protein
MRENYGTEGREYVWESKDLVTYEDVYRLISDRVGVSEHPVPENCVGTVYTVAGVAQASRAILGHIGNHIKALQKKESRTREESAR